LSRIRFLFASAALILATLALASCGGGNGDADPVSVLDEATLEGIESADLEATIAVTATGSEGGNLEISLSGPFEGVEGGSTPQLDMTAQATGRMNGKDVDFEGGLVLLPNSAYVNYQGTDYEVDPTTFGFIESALKQAQQQGQAEGEAPGASACQEAVARLKVRDFVDNLKNEGEADIGGTTTTKVSGDLDIPGAIDALLELYSDPACSAQLSAAGEQLPSDAELREAKGEVGKAVKTAHVDVYVGDDDIIRRLVARLKIEPPAQGKGTSSATVDFDVSLDGVNEEQEISTPATARPLNELFMKLGVNPLELLGVLQGEGDGLGDLLEGIEAESARGL
jgi:hypothetical protein